jgi:ABC-2 type transport system permease protein
MSAITETLRTPGRLANTVSDWWVITRRNLITYVRKPDLLVFSTIQPIMFVLLFVYVFGGIYALSFPPDVSYVDFLMPGIFVQTAIFAATQTGVGLADDLQKGLIDRFRSLPMARSAVLAGRTSADTVSVSIQTVLMLIVAFLVGYRFHTSAGEVFLSFLVIVGVGYAFTWVSAFAGLALKTIEAVQAALFTIVFPFVFVSTAFVPLDTFPSWLKPIAAHNPVTIWVDTVRVLTLGDLYTQAHNTASSLVTFQDVPALSTLLWQSGVWFAAFLGFFSWLGVRFYRKT